MSSKELRDYQAAGARVAADCISEYGIHYFVWSPRSGKTATALETCRLFGAKKVLFITKKISIGSINQDYIDFGFDKHFEIVIINKESVHKYEGDYDIVVSDENHAKISSFPKPPLLAKYLKATYSSKPFIMLSGTPCAESFSQYFHQFWYSDRSPWKQYSNFYKWSKDYVNVKQKRIGAHLANDYSEGKEDKIMADIAHLISTRTQKQSGFKSEITERVLYVKMKSVTHKITDTLLRDRVFEGTKDVILADTAAKLMQKLHQVYSGTCKLESGEAVIIDKTKAEFIKEYFKGKKLGIIYVFKKELDLLTQVFGADNVTNDLDEFNSTDKHFVGQVVSSREGISLYKADALVLYNIQHSSVSYIQVRDRMTLKDREENNVYLIFAEGGIEEKIYKVVKSKGKYTSNIFKKDYNVK
jgi:hypothetical protein